MKKKEELKKEIKDEVKKEIKEEENNGVFLGFFGFLKKYSIIALAVGIVIGDSSKALVNAIVSGIITPFLGLFLPSKETLQNFKIVIRHQTFEIGNVIQALISFLLILFIIYFFIKILLKKDEWIEEKKK